jgi:UDP-N-acetyl-2-amino-2-deoxyglucuronate dehydrogenase
MTAQTPRPLYRAAIIGLSWIGADPPQPATDPLLGTATPGTHASAMATIPEIEVVAGCDIFPAAREQFLARWGSVWPGVRVYEDFKELLAKEPVDFLSIVTPDHLHAPVLFAGLEAGVKGIFCDKPLSIDLAEADRMVAAARAAGVPLSVNYGRRWYPEYVEARRLIRDGAIGELVQVLIESGGPRAMLWRIHTHAIDLINYFADAEPAWVWADLERGMEDYGTQYKGDGGRDASKEPGVNAYIAFSNGIRGILTGWKRIPQDMVVHLVGTAGRIELDVEGWRIIRTPVNTDRAPTAGLANPNTTPVTPHYNVAGMPAAMRELIRAMETGVPTSSTGEMARRTVAITEAILQSAAQGNVRVPVTPPPAAE